MYLDHIERLKSSGVFWVAGQQLKVNVEEQWKVEDELRAKEQLLV